MLSRAPSALAGNTVTPNLWLRDHSLEHWENFGKGSLLPPRSWMQTSMHCSPPLLLPLTQTCLLSPRTGVEGGGQSTSNFPRTCLLSKPLVSFLTSGRPLLVPDTFRDFFPLYMQRQSFRRIQYLIFLKNPGSCKLGELFGFLDNEFQIHSQNLKSQ